MTATAIRARVLPRVPPLNPRFRIEGDRLQAKVGTQDWYDVGTLPDILDAGRPFASQEEAEAGENETHAMNPLRTAQALLALGSSVFASAAQGATADTALQSVVAGTNVTVDTSDPINPVINASSGSAANLIGIPVAVVDTTGLNPALDYEAGKSLDGHTLNAGDLILRATAAGHASDGLYVAPSSGAASRHPDYAAYDDMVGGLFTVLYGTAHNNKLFQCESDPGGTIDTTAIKFGVALNNVYQPLDAQLTALAGLTGANGSFVRWTGAAAAVMQAIVGTVSQSGGVPTGAIVERGSNANGNYVRFADGTQVCWGNISATVAISSAYQGGFRSGGMGSFGFPAAFSGSPLALGGPGDALDLFGGFPYGAGSTSFSGVAFAVTSQGSAARNLNWLAIGRWF